MLVVNTKTRGCIAIITSLLAAAQFALLLSSSSLKFPREDRDSSLASWEAPVIMEQHPQQQGRQRTANTMAMQVQTFTHIKWLHVPKTGTSFFSSIANTFCPRMFEENPSLKTAPTLQDVTINRQYPLKEWCDNVTFAHTDKVGYHFPIPKEGLPALKPSEKWTVLTMLRNPQQRLQSAFSFHRHNSKVQNDSQPIEEYIQESHIPNCQTKMLTGTRCHFDVPTGETLNVSKAMEWISSENFFFGITDRWHESICLFHAWFGGHIIRAELGNVRPTHRKRNMPFPSWYRDLDYDLWDHATEIFEERLLRAHCKGADYTNLTRVEL